MNFKQWAGLKQTEKIFMNPRKFDELVSYTTVQTFIRTRIRNRGM